MHISSVCDKIRKKSPLHSAVARGQEGVHPPMAKVFTPQASAEKPSHRNEC